MRRPQGILRLGTSFWASRTLLSAVELGVFTELAGGALDAESLGRRLGLHPRGTRDFLDSLVALGLLRRKNGLYRNAPDAGEFLDRGKGTYLGGLLEMLGARVFRQWAGLTETLRTGEPQVRGHNGSEPFEQLYSDPQALRSFLAAMTAASMSASRALAAKFPWRRYRSFADIGCAQGGTAVALAQAHPHLRGTGFDLPVVAPLFEEYVGSCGVGARVGFSGGDFFQAPLPQAEVLLMVQVLHDWDLARKQLLLAKAHAALPADGVLIVVDSLIDDQRQRHAFALLMSLNMLIETSGGFDYSAADGRQWLKAAGFRQVRRRALGGPYAMLIATK